MKRMEVWIAAVFVVGVVLAMARPVAAHDYQRGESDYPLRYVAYAIYPFGIALEYGVTRPIHWAVSRPYARVIFGHEPRNDPDQYGEIEVCRYCRPHYNVMRCPGCGRVVKGPDIYFEFR